ncbi:MAG: protein kinase [Acidobacteriia bacterium]|nr:protein kinase [Terriglobia bacterium]
MQNDRWQRIEALFEQAVELSVNDRSTLLADACREDVALRKEVESLLLYHDTAGGLMETPLNQVAAEVIAELQSAVPGQRIGNFKILCKLAQGGMGTVYLAVRDDDHFKKQVAIKVVNRGMDSELVLRRFRNERQILANLEHPNIGRLLDGGTTADGLPYFIMEYVEGRAIDVYCQEAGLDIDERLALFLKVCSAVQFAHQNLVVHRDIKPSNILIREDGEPKLLDFGIAKLLNPEPGSESVEGSFTGHQLMTPEYASPEQVRDEPMTTASDVYSLGVLLYRLLTGVRPYRVKATNLLELQEAICHQWPDKPSSAVAQLERVEGPNSHEKGWTEKQRKKLVGDIDSIIMKALRKEPHLRYQSVEQFAEDIRRHLDGRPVLARRGTMAYRGSKFISRHKSLVAASVLIVLILTAGIVATEIERAKAVRRFDQVRKLANSFMFEVEDEIDKGPTKAKELLVKKALEYLDSLAQESAGDRSLQRDLAAAYERMGRIQGNSYYSNLGDTEGGIKSYRKSLDLRLKLRSSDPKNPELQDELADSYEGLGDVLYTAGDLKAGLENYQHALELREPLVSSHPQNSSYRMELADLYGKVGDIQGMDGYPNLGNTEGALQSYRKSLSLHEQLSHADPNNRALQYDLAKTLISIGMLLHVTGEFQNAVAAERRGVALMESLAGREPANTEYQKQLLASYASLRYVLFDTGDLAGALAYDRKTLAQLEPMVARDPENEYLKRSLSVTYNSIGRGLLKMRDPEAALVEHHKALAISEELLRADPTSGEHSRDVAYTLQRIGDAQAAARDYVHAFDTYRKSLEICQKILAEDATDSVIREDVSSAYAGIGSMLAALGDTNGALKAFDEAVPLAEQVASQSPRNIRFQGQLARTLFGSGRVYAQKAAALPAASPAHKSYWQNARKQFQRSVTIWQGMSDRNSLSPSDANNWAEGKRALTRANGALARLT